MGCGGHVAYVAQDVRQLESQAEPTAHAARPVP
jgi:hypothetical protein